MATATQKSEVLFTARSSDLILTREPTREERDHTGTLKAIPGTGLQYQFEKHNLIVDDALEEKTRRYYERNPDDQYAGMSALEWLRQHRLNGSDENGFYEITPLAPDPGSLLAEIAIAASDRDEVKLAELYEAEQDGWQRPIVIETIEATLRAFEGSKAKE